MKRRRRRKRKRERLQEKLMAALLQMERNSLQKVYMNIVWHFLTVCQKQETNKLILYIFSCLSPQLIMLQTINLLQN